MVPLDDGYHTRLATTQTDAEAREEILDREEFELFEWPFTAHKNAEPFLVGNGLVNEADINSSVRSVESMRVLDETGGFGAFAEEWSYQMLDNGEPDRYVYGGTDSADIPQQIENGFDRFTQDLADRLIPDFRPFG